MDNLESWIGRSMSVGDEIVERLNLEFHAALDPFVAPVGPGDAPLGMHWCLAPPRAPISRLERDGLLADDGFRPPVPLPMRMAAGGDIRCFSPLPRIGAVTKRSTIEGIKFKEGRTGRLCFVTVGDDYEYGSGVVLAESKTVVFRDKAKTGTTPTPAKGPPEPRERSLAWRVEPSSMLLFRYSALTGNSHRIHYDAPYARDVEGYEGLVVHGPLQATLLLNIAAQIGESAPSSFSYRAAAALLATGPFEVCAGPAPDGSLRCWTEDASGARCMEAVARWS
jgi:3-methylfumaryl-CoA hydratase